MRIAILTVSFPVPSETFAITELDALCSEGVSIDVFPLVERNGVDLTGLLQPLLDSGKVKIRTPRQGGGSSPGQPTGFSALWLLLQTLTATWRCPLQVAKSLVLLRRSLWIHQQIQQERYDLVHCFWGHLPAAAGALVKRFSAIPVTLFLGSYDLEAPGPLTRWLHRHADCVVTHAEVNRAQLHDRLGQASRLQVIHRGIRLPEAPPQARDPERLQLVFAGRLISSKGAADAVETVRLLHDKGQPARLLLAGDGPEAESIREYVATAGLNEWVRVPGFLAQNDLFSQLEQAHFLLLPSRDPGERLPNVVKEAMARGVVPVLYPSPGLPELLGPDFETLVVDSPTTMAQVVLATWQHPERHKAMAHRGHERVVRNFQVTDSAERLATLWRSIVQEPSARA